MPAQSINFLTPDLQAEELGIERKRRMADALLQQGMAPSSPGQMVGRFYVPSSPLQGLAKAFQAYAGIKGQEKADTDTADLYRRGLEAQRQAAETFVQGASNAPDEATFNRALMNYGSAIGQPSIGVTPAVNLAQHNFRLRSVGLQPGGTGAQYAVPQAPQPASIAGTQLASNAPGVPDLGGAPAAQSPLPAPLRSSPALGNVPPNVAAMLLSQDPGIQALGKAILEQDKPVVGREGAPILERQPDGSYKVVFYAPKTEPGVQLNLAGNGQVTGASQIPGYTEAISGIEGAKAGAQAQYRTVDVPVGGGATRPIPASQIPSALGGVPQPAPQPQGRIQPLPGMVPPQDMAAFNAVAQAAQNGQTLTAQGGFPAPTPGPMPGAGRTQTTQESAEARQYGEGLGKAAEGVNANAANAAISNRYIDVLDSYAKDFTPDKLAPLQSNLIQWKQAMGLPVTDEDKRAAGSIQGVASIAIKMAGQATRQSDAQPSQLQFLKTLESMPTEQRTPDGMQRILAYLRDTNNQSIAKAQALQQWRMQHGTADGFDAAWPAMAAQMPFIWNQQPHIAPAAATPTQARPTVKWNELGRGR